MSSSFKYLWKQRNGISASVIKQKIQNLYKGVQVMSPAGNLECTYPLLDTFWNNTGLRGTVFLNKNDGQKEGSKRRVRWFSY